jgi:hypothetical protein
MYPVLRSTSTCSPHVRVDTYAFALWRLCLLGRPIIGLFGGRLVVLRIASHVLGGALGADVVVRGGGPVRGGLG